MVKSSRYDKNGLKKGAWSEDEDEKLRAYIHRYGHWNWGLLPKFAGVSRSGKSCRLRWMNYLRPNMKHGNFTKQEDDLLIDLHNQLGNKWSAIAAKIPGRSDNEIKNRWNTSLKKRVPDDQLTMSKSKHIGTLEPDKVNPEANQVDGSSHQLAQQTVVDDETIGDFWTEPFVPNDDADYNLLSPFNFDYNDFTWQSYSCQDSSMLTDEFLWSTLDSDQNIEFIMN